jgi:hypothetical protein
MPQPFMPMNGDGSTGGNGNGDLSGGGKVDAGPADLMATQLDLAGTNVPGAPVIVINSPKPTDEVAGDQLKVSATITSPTNTPIDPSTAVLIVAPPGSQPLSTALSLTGPNTYSGTINVSAFPSTTQSFTVTAADIMGRSGNATGMYIHDHGPVISFLNPTDPSYSGKLPLPVDVIVDDPLHPITDPTKVWAYLRQPAAPGDIPLTVTSTSPLRLTAQVDMSNAMTWGAPLDGPQVLTVSANNGYVTTSATRSFIVDNEGPVLSNMQVVLQTPGAMPQPAQGAFVAGEFDLQVNIVDQSAVDASSVKVVFGGDQAHPLPLTLMAGSTTTYHTLYDVRPLGTGYVYLEISVRATDKWGNQSQLGAEAFVDNSPPWLSLNPPLMRVRKYNPYPVLECSVDFDPVGTDTAKEGTWVQQIVTLRARVEDQGNTAGGIEQLHISKIDPNSVYLFAMPAPTGTEVLAVDTNNDGICDDVNHELVPTSGVVASSNEALSLKLAALSFSGSAADFSPFPTVPANLQSVCRVMGDASGSYTTPPPCLACGAPFRYVVPYALDTSPSIWVIPSTNPALDCAGLQLDTANHLPEGPTCIVVVGKDQAGNTNVSAPLHICIDRSNDNGAKCAGYTQNAPNPNGPKASLCTGVADATGKPKANTTCKPSPAFDYSNTAPGEEVRMTN